MTTAVIVAAGAGTRLPAAVPKPFLMLGNRTVLDRTIEVFQCCEAVERVVVVVAPAHVAEVRSRATGKVAAVVAGGGTRRASVAAGLAATADAEWVVVHDGVRPFVTPALIARVLQAARRSGAATAGLPVTETIKDVVGDRVCRTIDRSRLWAVQTPQAFRADVLRDAHAEVGADEPVTDDAELVERLGREVLVVPGEPRNVKITTPHDLEAARHRVYAEEGGLIRVGMGYDVHRFVPDRALVLGGVTIPHDRGLDGHSDADVLAHAVMDALLGAAGERDIGSHFPPDDPAFRNADSLRLLAVVRDRVRAGGWLPVNVDVVVIAEGPRLAPHMDAMRARLAAALEVQPGQIGVKATTGEGLGALGRGDGIAAHAVVLLRRSA
ncbi:MAG: 2-C-methyl-D-erythritol 4-phosphate cytidylyltransferase [Armatimonadota bacterium]|nr:2-C-methyl-D-erythritol 4-phosphate cytidylyltransferase [Armatimonadota bacterium]